MLKSQKLRTLKCLYLVRPFFLMLYISAFLFSQQSFRQKIEAYNISSDFSNYFSTVAEYVSKDYSYDPYFDLVFVSDDKQRVILMRDIITNNATQTENKIKDIRERIAESTNVETNTNKVILQAEEVASLMREIDSLKYNLTRLYRALFSVLAEKGYLEEAAKLAQFMRESETAKETDQIIALKSDLFYNQKAYNLYIQIAKNIENPVLRNQEAEKLSHAYFFTGQYEKAISNYIRILSNEGLSQEAYINCAKIFFLRGEYEKSLSFISNIKGFEEGGDETYYEASYYKSAIGILTLKTNIAEEIEVSVNDERFYLLGIYYLLIGDYSNSTTYFEQSLAYHSTLSQNKMAMFFMDALTDASIDKNSYPALANYGRSLLSENATKVAESIIGISSSKIPERLRLASLYKIEVLSMEDANTAYEYISTISSNSEYYIPSLYIGGRLLLKLGKTNEAIKKTRDYLIGEPYGVFSYKARESLKNENNSKKESP